MTNELTEDDIREACDAACDVDLDEVNRELADQCVRLVRESVRAEFREHELEQENAKLRAIVQVMQDRIERLEAGRN
jgi:hypothetical protein